MPSYTFRGLTIPDHMMAGIRRYIDKHTPPGHFLCAVISNDLKEAVAHADEENLKILSAYVGYFYNHAPSTCWGSEEALKRWVAVPQRQALWERFQQRVKDECLPRDFLEGLVHNSASLDGLARNASMEKQFNWLFDQYGPEGLARELQLGDPADR